METCARWTAQLAASFASSPDKSPAAPAPARGAAASAMDMPSSMGDGGSAAADGSGGLAGAAASWRVLDVGTGNGMLLHALADLG